MESLTEFEGLCLSLYSPQDAAERAHAETVLQSFSTESQNIPQCQYILANSSSPYAQLLASSSLIKQVTEHNLTQQLRLDIHTYVMNYLASKGHELQSFVTTSLIQLLCRLSKLGWFDANQFRDIVKGATNFLVQGTADHYYIGLKILNQLVVEMNQVCFGVTLTHHRKTAFSFRDIALLQVFELSLNPLKRLQMDGAAERLQEQAVGLALKCLSFDFVGSSDESSEELGTIQALECLVRLASVRRSFFRGEAERCSFLSLLMCGTGEILRLQNGLGEHANYHAFCRLLSRFKTNFQLSELISDENYGDWICLVADFTIMSLQSWQWASGSLYYLLGLWSKLVSVTYSKSDPRSHLEDYVFKIVKAYLASRFDAVEAVVGHRISEDPLDSGENLEDQLDSVSDLCRFQYERTSEYILGTMKPIIQAFANGARGSGATSGIELQTIEGQLTWLVHIIGSIIRGPRASTSRVEPHEEYDGELAAWVFQLLQLMDEGVHAKRYKEKSRQSLDLAILSFFLSFRRAYIGDHAVMSSKQLYARLMELLGLHDHVMVLNAIVLKIGINLRCYSESEILIEHTLKLFQELASGYTSGKLMLKLEAVDCILGHHTRDQFPFLEQHGNSHNRTSFYHTLSRLIFMEDSTAKFRRFIAPLEQVLVHLQSVADASCLAENEKHMLVGLMRDLRGIAMAANSRRTYGLVFEWLYPSHLGIVLRAVELWADCPEVMTPVLKFVAEFVLNKTQRLTFDSSSPNGICLFREVSKIVVAYGTRISSICIVGELYSCKYKGIWIVLTILTRALAGNYVNFGVIELYGDPSLSDALDISLRLSLDISLPDVMAFRKLARAYFAFLEVLCHNHTLVILNLERARFAHVVASLEVGLKCLDVSISSQCAAAVDNLAAFYFNHLIGGHPLACKSVVKTVAEHATECPKLFPQVLKTLFNIILFEDAENQWSLSRPMLSIILVNEQAYSELKTQFLLRQPQDQQQRLSSCFNKLMADVSRTLEPKNRDRFHQNLLVFRNDFRAK